MSITIPADLAPDLLEGWAGPVILAGRECVLVAAEPPVLYAATEVEGRRIIRCRAFQGRLDLSRDEVRDRLVRWGAEEPRNCDLGWARDNPEALAWAVRRLARGEAVLGAYGPWAFRRPWERWGLTCSGRLVAPCPDDRATIDARLATEGWWLEGGPAMLEGEK